MLEKRQIPFGRPMIAEEERKAVAEVMSGPILVHGPRASDFETAFAKFVGASHAVSVSSCTAGMHLIWFALGFRAGDEVIVPAMTHVATAHAVELTGARPVFVDAEAETGNIDIAAIEAAISPRTRAIVIVHYLGMPVDMAEVVTLARKHRLFVMEDCALALGSQIDGIHAGLLGDCGVFSFYPVKHMTTAEGGMIVLRDGKLAEVLRLKKAFGVDRAHGERKMPGVYDVVALGFNYRMSEIHAAIGIEQLKKVPDFLRRRRANAEALAAALATADSIRLLPSTAAPRLTGSYYCSAALLDPVLASKRPQIVTAMSVRGVGTSVYYPQPVPRMAYYAQKYGWKDGSFPNAERIADHSLALSVGPHLDSDDMTFIAAALVSAIGSV